MKTVLLLLFTMHQMFLISSALKCYECAGDCAAPKEKDCDAAIKCCYSSVDPIGGAGGAEPPASPPSRKRSADHSAPEASVTRRVHFTRFLDEAAPASAAPAAGAPAAGTHKHKGCCTDKTTKDTCKEDKCYMCEADLCNKEDTPSSATSLLASILNVLLPLTIIGVAIGSPKKLIN